MIRKLILWFKKPFDQCIHGHHRLWTKQGYKECRKHNQTNTF